MKILLTGSNGMVGKNILEYKSLQNYDFLTPSSKELNLLNYQDVKKYIAINQPDFIIHAAGKVGGIQANIKNPVSFLIENIDMGRNVIIAAKENNIKNSGNLKFDVSDTEAGLYFANITVNGEFKTIKRLVVGK